VRQLRTIYTGKLITVVIKEVMNFREKVLGTIFIILGLTLGLTLSARGDSPGQFFTKNLATCFYCNGENSINSGLKIETPNMENVRARLGTAPIKGEENEGNEGNKEQKIEGLDEKAPEPFKDLMKAYESGNMDSAYSKAKRWVKYQDKVLKRTSDLSALVKKARLEVDAEEEIEKDLKAQEESNSGSSIEASLNKTLENAAYPLRLYFFFDAKSASSIQGIAEIQLLNEKTISRNDIEIIGIADGEVSIEDLAELKSSTKITFPVRFDHELANAFEISKLPSLVAIDNYDPKPIFYRGPLAIEQIWDFIDFSLKKMKGNKR